MMRTVLTAIIAVFCTLGAVTAYNHAIPSSKDKQALSARIEKAETRINDARTRMAQNLALSGTLHDDATTLPVPHTRLPFWKNTPKARLRIQAENLEARAMAMEQEAQKASEKTQQHIQPPKNKSVRGQTYQSLTSAQKTTKANPLPTKKKPISIYDTLLNTATSKPQEQSSQSILKPVSPTQNSPLKPIEKPDIAPLTTDKALSIGSNADKTPSFFSGHDPFLLKDILPVNRLPYSVPVEECWALNSFPKNNRFEFVHCEKPVDVIGTFTAQDIFEAYSQSMQTQGWTLKSSGTDTNPMIILTKPLSTNCVTDIGFVTNNRPGLVPDTIPENYYLIALNAKGSGCGALKRRIEERIGT